MDLRCRIGRRPRRAPAGAQRSVRWVGGSFSDNVFVIVRCGGSGTGLFGSHLCMIPGTHARDARFIPGGMAGKGRYRARVGRQRVAERVVERGSGARGSHGARSQWCASGGGAARDGLRACGVRVIRGGDERTTACCARGKETSPKKPRPRKGAFSQPSSSMSQQLHIEANHHKLD